MNDDNFPDDDFIEADGELDSDLTNQNNYDGEDYPQETRAPYKHGEKQSSPAKKLMIAAVLLIAAAFGQHIFLDLSGAGAAHDLRMVHTEAGISYSFDVHADFYSPGARHFFYAARDGVQSISSDGDLRWQHGFDMSQPVMVGRGDKIAIGEPGGTRIYVFGSSGYVFSTDLPYAALYYTVNPAGFLSVIMQTDTGYLVQVFHSDPRYSFRAPINDPNVFPFTADVSECGTFIAIARLDVSTFMVSHISKSFFSRVDSRGMQDGLFASYSFPDEMVARVRFTGGGSLIAVTDRQIMGFSGNDNTQGALWSIPFTNQPDVLYIGENYFAYVTGTPFINTPEAESTGILRIYDFNGNLTGTFDLERRATHLSMAHNTVLVGTDRTFYAINTQGRLLWTYNATQDVIGAIFLDNTDTILLAGGTRAGVLRRMRV